MSVAATLCLDNPSSTSPSSNSNSIHPFKVMRLNHRRGGSGLSERTISVSKLSRALSKLSLRSPGGTVHVEARAYRVEQAKYLDALNSSSNANQILSKVSLPSGLSKDRVREYIYSIAISPLKGTVFLPRHSEIIPKYLYMSDSYTGTDPRTLAKLGITHVISINNGPQFEPTSPPSSPLSSLPKLSHIKHHIITPPHPSLHLPSSKKAPSYIAIFDKAVDFMDDAFRDRNSRILVHDRLGSDWSASVVVAWVTRNQSCSYEQACIAVRQRREVVNPSWEVEKGVKEWMGLEHARAFFPIGRGGRCYVSSDLSSSSSRTKVASSSASTSSASHSDSDEAYEDVIDIR